MNFRIGRAIPCVEPAGQNPRRVFVKRECTLLHWACYGSRQVGPTYLMCITLAVKFQYERSSINIKRDLRPVSRTAQRATPVEWQLHSQATLDSTVCVTDERLEVSCPPRREIVNDSGISPCELAIG